MTQRTVRIGCGAGFWGDTSEGPLQLVTVGEIDYLVLDYLAEMTMSILARVQARNPTLGYAEDFIRDVMVPLGARIADRRIKVISNAGGLNPSGCALALEKALAQAGIHLKVAAVVGDDARHLLDSIETPLDLDSGMPMPDGIMTANAYVGAFPIAQALADGADVVVVGRCTDSALALGPLIHEFGWKPVDWNLLAAGSLAGHVIECGPQVTGGYQTDWAQAADSWDTIGFPIVECYADGTFVVAKPEGTGGIVNVGNVAEQITYETGDPEAYILPDVVCDLSRVTVRDVGPNRVLVSGVSGKPATNSYKVSATYRDGYRCTALMMIRGIDAIAKARAVATAVLRRTGRIFQREGLAPYTETSVEILGTEEGYGRHSRIETSREVILKIAARHSEKRALDILAREVAPPGTSMAPGTSGISARPKVQDMVRLFSFLIEKSALTLSVQSGGRSQEVPIRTEGKPVALRIPSQDTTGAAGQPAADITVPLVKVAVARSGDKGDTSNVAILARDERLLPILRQQLTAEALASYMEHLVSGDVVRYDWPGLNGFNFLFRRALGGGGIASLRFDPQGKSHAQILLDFPIRLPAALQDAIQ